MLVYSAEYNTETEYSSVPDTERKWIVYPASDSAARPRLAVFHNLPVGGGINVAGALLCELENFFSVTVHYPEGSSSIALPDSISRREWPFREGKRLAGLRKLAAPFILKTRLRNFEALCRTIAKEINSSADVVLVHNSMFIAAPPILNYLTIPSVYFCYEYPRHLYEPELIRRTSGWLSRLLLSPLRHLERKMDMDAITSADETVTFSDWMKNRISDIYGVDSLLVGPGVDTDFWRREKNAVQANRIISIGALWPFKGHEMAIKSVSLIQPEIRPSITVIADREFPGYGAQLKKTAQSCGVDLNLLMRVTREELRQYYSTSKAVICCQHNEPYGLVPLEAMACGVPVIAVREGGFVDNINSGQNGILVDRDPADMAGALEDILMNDRLRENLISGGIEFVTRNRTTGKAGSRLASILKETMS